MSVDNQTFQNIDTFKTTLAISRAHTSTKAKQSPFVLTHRHHLSFIQFSWKSILFFFFGVGGGFCWPTNQPTIQQTDTDGNMDSLAGVIKLYRYTADPSRRYCRNWSSYHWPFPSNACQSTSVVSESTGITVLGQFTGSETFTHTTAFQCWNYIRQFENVQKGAKNYTQSRP